MTTVMDQSTESTVSISARDHDPELAKRIVFLSGGAFTESAQTFLDRTPNLRIDKPFDVGQILSVVAQFVDGK